MAFKFVALFALVAVASAVPVEYQQPHHYQPAPLLIKKVVAPQYHNHHEEEKYAPAEYQFNYEVHDEHTGDIKSHEETRHGDQVQGKYTLIDADGYRRIVEYTADDHHGFNAVVHREPVKGYQAPQEHKQYYAPAPVVQKYVTAPVVQKYVAAPVVKYQAAPVIKYAAAPVAKIITPVVHAAPQYHHQQPAQYHSDGHHSSHVTFSGPASNYHY